MADIVTFKGIRDGLELRLDGNESFEVICDHLRQKLVTSSAFFNAGLKVTIICEARDLLDEEQSLLKSILEENELVFHDILREPPMKVNRVFAILSNDDDEIPEEPIEDASEEASIVNENDSEREKTFAESSEELKLFDVDPALMESGDEEEDVFIYRRTLRNGQTISYDGKVLVIGDINPGAEVIAGGDVVVEGNCRGVIRAGIPDNRDATITATKLMATQIRIADVIARSPDKREKPEYSERAVVRDGKIMIERV